MSDQPDQPESTALTQLVDFGSYEVDSAADETSEAAKHGGKGEWFKFKSGPNILRILPPGKGQKSPFKVRWRHWIDLPNGQSVKFNCPKMMAKQHCPICEKSDAYKAAGDKASRDKGFDMSPSRRGLFAAIDRTDPSRGPVIIDAPGKLVYDPLVSLRQDPRGGGDFTHPVQGFDVIIKRTGDGGKQRTGYEVLADRNNTPLADTVDQMNDWIMGYPDLGKYMTTPTPDEIKKMFADAMGQESTDDAAPQVTSGNSGGGGQNAQGAVYDTTATETGPETDGAVGMDDIPF